MIFKTEHLLIFTLFPLIGLLSSYIFPPKTIKHITIGLLLLILPIFSGYDFVIDWVYEFNLTLLLACVYYFLTRQEEKTWKRISATIILSLVLFFPLAYNAFLDNFAGNQYIERKWEKEGYQIHHIRDQGFSGRPAFYYEIIDSPLNGLFLKKLTSRGIKTDHCTIVFRDQNIELNICD